MRISIVTPSFNQYKFIRRTLDSVLGRQNYNNIEHLVIDGLSTDGTVDILKEYKIQYPEKLFYVSEKDTGQSNAINKGFRRAIGDIIGWINSDDFYEDNIFNFVIEYFKNNPDIDMIYGSCNVVNKDGNFITKFEDEYPFKKCKIDYQEFSYDTLINVYSGLIPQQSVFFRKSVFNKVGYLDESYSLVMDYEYWLRIGKYCQIKRVDKVLSNFRFHEEAKTTFDNRLHIIVESLQARRRNGGSLITRFYLYVGHITIKTIGRIFLMRLGFMKERKSR